MQSEKEKLRSTILKRRLSIPNEIRHAQQRELDRLLVSEIKKNPNAAILSYRGFRGEYDPSLVTRECAERIWCFPRIQFDQNKIPAMEFYVVKDLATMIPNKIGIEEPSPTLHKLFRPKGEVIMIVPSVAMTRAGDRLGYGNGFYDRYLEIHAQSISKTIAPVFSCQIVDSVFAEDHDHPIELVLTARDLTNSQGTPS